MAKSSPKWYVVHVYSGFEQKVAETIRAQAQKKGLDDKIIDVMVPIEEVIEIKKGEKVASQRKFFPGYVLVKMELTDEAWHMVRNLPKVSGFLGGDGKPRPVNEAEIKRLTQQIEEGVARPKTTVSFVVGETVRVCDGPFNSFSGMVEDVDEEKSRLKVSVSIFGRATPVELEFSQVEKT